MKKKIFWIAVLVSFNCFSGEKFMLSDSVFNNSTLLFLEHKGEGRFSSYLSMQIQFEPIADLFKMLLLKKRFKLTNRGEAHITVITPVEYYDVLKEKISIDEIATIAQKSNIQQSKFKVVCLGRAKKEIKDKSLKTFFVVVESDDLLRIRTKIQSVFLKRGGNKKLFRANHFFPHVTLGFTKRDLHESDGVIKDKNSCHAAIEISKTIKAYRSY